MLGPPQHAGTVAEGIEALRYTQSPRAEPELSYGVIFKNGEVTDYGLESGIRLGGHYAIHEVFTSGWRTNFAPAIP